MRQNLKRLSLFLINLEYSGKQIKKLKFKIIKIIYAIIIPVILRRAD